MAVKILLFIFSYCILMYFFVVLSLEISIKLVQDSPKDLITQFYHQQSGHHVINVLR